MQTSKSALISKVADLTELVEELVEENYQLKNENVLLRTTEKKYRYALNELENMNSLRDWNKLKAMNKKEWDTRLMDMVVQDSKVPPLEG